MRTPRLYVRGKIYEVCFRTEEGLPLVCTPYMRAILLGIITEAFSAYDIELIAFVVMGNHIHILIRIGNPDHLDDLVCYIKRESAHAINNLLGRRRHTVWAAGYDAVIILDAEKMIDRLCYVFLNPARANLETSIEKYPGLNSWNSLLKENYQLSGRRIPRETIPPLPNQTLSFSDQQSFAEELLAQALPEQAVEIDPFLWLEAFPETQRASRQEIRSRIIRSVREAEVELERTRVIPVIGAHALKLQSIRIPYTPKKFGKKMWCFGSTRAIRMPYINWLKDMLAIRSRLKEKLSPEEFRRQLPPGFFAPGGFLRANLLPHFLPI